MLEQLDQVVAVLSRAGLTPMDSEYDLQEKIETALSDAGVEFLREAVLSSGDRIDFLAGSVGIEVKVRGPGSAVSRQLVRYAAVPEIEELVLVTTKPSMAYGRPLRLGDKPLSVVCAWRHSL